jgi:hypothetical protein
MVSIKRWKSCRVRVEIVPPFGDEKSLRENQRNRRSLHYATPDFLSRLVALASFMRLSLPKAAHVDVGEDRVAGNPGSLRSG